MAARSWRAGRPPRRSPRGLTLRRLIIAVVILGGVGTVADLGARSWAAGQIESRARAELPSQVKVNANIRSFPFLPSLLLGGQVSEASGHFENVPAGPLTLASVDVELRGVKIDRGKLLNDREVRLVSISGGTVSIEISASVLSRAIHLPVRIADGEVKVTVNGVTAAARVGVANNALVLTAGPITQRVPIPKTRLIPCTGNSVTVLAGRIRLACTIRNIPPALLGEANAQLNG